jgi:REP element-mobilizing transposase RayT
MPRLRRIFEPFGYYHVYSRGNNGGLIFWSERDRRAFLELLAHCVDKHDVTLLAYVLMPNHYHLVVQSGELGLSRFMQELNGGYSRLISKRRNRTRHLFQNRFGCEWIESDAYLLESCRYAVNNPVRAGLSETAADWRWSSYRATRGRIHAPRWLAATHVLELLSPVPAAARARYAEFVDDGALLIPMRREAAAAARLAA